MRIGSKMFLYSTEQHWPLQGFQQGTWEGGKKEKSHSRGGREVGGQEGKRDIDGHV